LSARSPTRDAPPCAESQQAKQSFAVDIDEPHC
jgi:hypothetical protein